MKFIQKQNIVVNIENVSSIMFEKSKVIFNFNYGITLSHSDKIIPDYVYFDKDEETVSLIKDTIITRGWVNFKNSDNPNRWVNPNCISFIKYDERNNKYRIIANLNASVSLSKYENVLTSDAVYWDFIDFQDFQDAKTSLEFLLNVDYREEI